MMSPATITLIVLAVTAFLFIREVIPVPLTAMLCAAVLVFAGIAKPSDVIGGFSNTTVIILNAMLIVGGALFETGVTDKIAKSAVKIAKTERQMIMVIFILGSLLSALLNNTGTMAMMIPIILGIQTSIGYSASRLMMAGFLGVMCGGRLTLVGDATVNTIAQAAILSVGGSFGFLDIGKIGLPLTIATGLWLYFFGYKTIPVRKAAEDSIYANGTEKTAPVWKQVMSIVIIAGVFFGMAFNDAIKVPLYWVAMVGAIAVWALGILNTKQVCNLVDLKTVFLYVGMLPLGTALKTTGAAKMIANVVSILVGGSGNVYLITALMFIVACFMTQFTSNVVTINLLAPIAIAIASTLHVSATALIVTTCIACTMGYVSPVACPPATIIYGSGGFKFTDYAKSNWSILIISFLICVFLLPTMWPL